MVTPSDTADVRDRDSEQPAATPDATPSTSLPGAVRESGSSAGHGRRWFRYTLPGCWVALVFVCLAFTPSLVPRPGAFQGVVCGLTGAIGYGLGVAAAWLWRQFADRPARRPETLAWRIFGIVAVVGLLTFYLLGQRWQGQIRALVGADPDDLGSRLILPV